MTLRLLSGNSKDPLCPRVCHPARDVVEGHVGLRLLNGGPCLSWRFGASLYQASHDRLSSEMVGDAEHEQVGAVVSRDVATVEGELGEVVFVLDEGGD